MNGKLCGRRTSATSGCATSSAKARRRSLHGRYLVVVWDHQGESFIVALDKSTGEEIWRVKRDEIDTWATPLVVEHDGRPQVVTAGMNRLRSYDLETGQGRVGEPRA